MIHGDDILVTTNIGGSQMAVAASKSCDLDISRDFIKACAPNSGRTFQKIPTTYDWSVSCDCLMATSRYAKQLLNAVRNGTKYTLQFIACGFKVVGDVYVKSCRIKATKGSLAKLSVSFESSGPLRDSDTWDVINGTLYTYTLNNNFSDGTLMAYGEVADGTLQQEEE